MYRKKLWQLIFVTTVLRILAASILELGNDEVYYYTYALHIQSNYFDHPPGVALLIRIFTLNLSLHYEAFVRLGSVCCAAVGTFLAFKIGEGIKNEKTGWFAALLYSTSLYTSIIAGIFILPDSPQVIFWLASLWYMLQITRRAQSQLPVGFITWVALGVTIGLCILCKVHGVFLWLGLGLYIVSFQRNLLKEPGLYMGALITACIVSPVIFWNINNQFVTWNYHSHRVNSTHFDRDGFFQALLGQFFYNNPVNVMLTILGIRGTCYVNKANFASRILLCCGFPIIITVTIMSAFNTVLPHWSGPGFLSLLFFAALYLEQTPQNRSRKYPGAIKYASGFIFALFTLGMLLIELYPGTLGKRNKIDYGENDFTLDMYGWKNFGGEFSKWYTQQQGSKQVQSPLKIVDGKWFPAAHLDFYVAYPLRAVLIGKGSMQDLHHFLWLNNYRPPLRLHDTAMAIVPSNYPTDPTNSYRDYFDHVTLIKTFIQYRSGQICRYFRVYRLENYNGR